MFLTSSIRKQGSNIFSVGYHSPIRTELNLMSLKHWTILLGRPRVVMISLSISKSLIRIGRERIRVDSRKMVIRRIF
jgi:hypothetical protein